MGDWQNFDNRAVIGRALRLRREIDEFESRWPSTAAREENLPTFSWEQLERPLLEAHGFLAATISSSGATTGSSGLGHCPSCTVRSSIADARVTPLEREPEPEEDYKMLRPGFEPGISDSKGRYA